MPKTMLVFDDKLPMSPDKLAKVLEAINRKDKVVLLPRGMNITRVQADFSKVEAKALLWPKQQQSTRIRKVGRLISAPKSAYRIHFENRRSEKIFDLTIHVYDTSYAGNYYTQYRQSSYAGNYYTQYRQSSRLHARGSAVLFKEKGGPSVVGLVAKCSELVDRDTPIVSTIVPELGYKLEQTEWGTICHNPLIYGNKGIKAIGWHSGSYGPTIFGISAEDVWEQLRATYVADFMRRAEVAINAEA